MGACREGGGGDGELCRGKGLGSLLLLGVE